MTSFQDYKDLQEKEDLKETEEPDEDPACYDTVHNGREVRVCICTGDMCNHSSALARPPWAAVFLLLIVSNVG